MSQLMPSGGRLRTYLGIAPGVGKTYEMLRDARARRRAGVDAVVAYRERHGRAATAAQLADLEVVPTRTVTYRGVSFDELDVTAVLDRGPELALVDELAHANLPGERHAKRWQDVAELLASELHGTMVEVRAGDVASGLIRAARQAGACQLVIGSPPPLALVASAERLGSSRPGPPRGWRPARPGRERRADRPERRHLSHDASRPAWAAVLAGVVRGG